MFGRKKWTVLSANDAMYSKEHIKAWREDAVNTASGPHRAAAHSCKIALGLVHARCCALHCVRAHV